VLYCFGQQHAEAPAAVMSLAYASVLHQYGNLATDTLYFQNTATGFCCSGSGRGGGDRELDNKTNNSDRSATT
jgi:hypothetical protein